MNAAASSCRTWINRIFSWRVRKRFHDAVDAVTGQAENRVDAPIPQ